MKCIVLEQMVLQHVSQDQLHFEFKSSLLLVLLFFIRYSPQCIFMFNFALFVYGFSDVWSSAEKKYLVRYESVMQIWCTERARAGEHCIQQLRSHKFFHCIRPKEPDQNANVANSQSMHSSRDFSAAMKNATHCIFIQFAFVRFWLASL